MRCCALECVDCGIDVRFHAEGPIFPVEETSSSTRENICNCEFDCSNDDGSEIIVVAKVKMYCEQLRAGIFQKEMEEVEMTLGDFKAHFIKCAKKYLIHHFNDVLSSQARRNLYEKMTVCPEFATTIILALDYSAIMDGHSQDQLNQTIQLHSTQLVILVSHLSVGVLMTTAYSFWHQQGTAKLKSDNHYYRQCKDRVISDVKEKSIPFDRVMEITDGAAAQFKNRFNMIQLENT